MASSAAGGPGQSGGPAKFARGPVKRLRAREARARLSISASMAFLFRLARLSPSNLPVRPRARHPARSGPLPAAASPAPRARRARAARPLAGALALGLLACSSAHFDGQVFRRGDVAFRLQRLPKSWRPLQLQDTALAFRDDERETTVAVNGRCGQDAEDVPLQSLTRHLFLQFTERSIASQERMPLDGREALRTRMVAKLDGVQKHFDVIVLKKDGCVYDFLQIASARQDPQDFLDFVRGFSSLS